MILLLLVLLLGGCKSEELARPQKMCVVHDSKFSYSYCQPCSGFGRRTGVVRDPQDPNHLMCPDWSN